MASTSRGTGAWFRTTAACALLFCLATVGLGHAFAGEKKDYALIYGTVFNAEGRIVPGVPVKIQRVGDKKPKYQLVSDNNGEFAQRVPTGDNEYLVIADIKSAKGTEKPQTKVHIYANERADISLHLSK